MNSCQVHNLLISVTAVSFTLGCAKKVTEPTERPPAAKPSASSAQTEALPTLQDSDINDAVKLGLTGDPGVDAKRINVKTSGGTVELSGNVSDLLAKRRATLAAEKVKGVRAVNDRLALDQLARPDVELEKDVKSSMSINAATSSLSVQAAVKGGTVTLTGNVKSWSQREVAERLAEAVRGVREVKNQLAVEPLVTRSDVDVQKDVTSRFHWDRLLDDGLIGVAIKHGKVTLKGVVRSAAERRRASRLAWVGGAKAVDDAAVTVDWSAKEREVRKNKVEKISDAQIAQAIRDAAALDPWMMAAKLEVNVASGNATLRGNVASLEGKTAAERVAHDTLGVNDVNNQLEVVPHSSVADSALEEHVRNVLRYDPAMTSFAVGVASKGGTVSLTGSVKTAFERALATELASGVLGVKRVDNQLKLDRPEVAYVYDWYMAPYEPYIASFHYAPATPTTSDFDIDKQIKRELMASPFVDANAVKVAVVAGKATLSGSVESVRDKREATQYAFEGGAVAVENRLNVQPTGG